MQSSDRDDLVVRALSEYVLANGGEISSTSGVADFYRQAGDYEDVYKQTLRGLGQRKAEVYKRHGLVLEKRSVGSDVIKLLDDPERGEASRAGFFDVVQRCQSCGSKAAGRAERGAFYCNGCWKVRNKSQGASSSGDETETSSNYRTKPCTYFEKGMCKYGDQCTFLHAGTTQGGGGVRSGGGGEEPFEGRVTYLHSQHQFAVVDHEIYIPMPLPSGLDMGWRVWGTKTAGQAKAKYKWKAMKVGGANATRESGSGGGGITDGPADQRAQSCKFFAQGACSFGNRCRFRHDRTSSSAQSSVRSASGPRQPPATQLKCTADVVKLKRKADGARAALPQHTYKLGPAAFSLPRYPP
jgi:hypothetical protein